MIFTKEGDVIAIHCIINNSNSQEPSSKNKLQEKEAQQLCFMGGKFNLLIKGTNKEIEVQKATQNENTQGKNLQ